MKVGQFQKTFVSIAVKLEIVTIRKTFLKVWAPGRSKAGLGRTKAPEASCQRGLEDRNLLKNTKDADSRQTNKQLNMTKAMVNMAEICELATLLDMGGGNKMARK